MGESADATSQFDDLVTSLFDTMKRTGADFTNTFRVFGELPYPSAASAYPAAKESVLHNLLSQCCTLDELKKTLRPTMDPRQLQMLLMMAQSQPMFLAMMGMEGKLKAELDRREKLQEMQHLTSESKTEKDRELWTTWLDKYEAVLKQQMEMLLKKGTTIEAADATRKQIMTSSNPRFILRNWVAQNAISKAEEGDYEEVKNVLRLLENPFGSDVLQDRSKPEEATEGATCATPPEKAGASCSAIYQSCAGIDYASPPPNTFGELRVT